MNTSPVFECAYYKSQDGRLYTADNYLQGPYVWRAESPHPHYPTKIVWAYGLTSDAARLQLFNKWTYLLNRGTSYPRKLTSQVCGYITVKKAAHDPSKWEASSEGDILLTAYDQLLETAVEKLERAYIDEQQHIPEEDYHLRVDDDDYTDERDTRSEKLFEDERLVYQRLISRGYTDAECEGEPGVNGDSLHKPGLTKEKLDAEMDAW